MSKTFHTFNSTPLNSCTGRRDAISRAGCSKALLWCSSFGDVSVHDGGLRPDRGKFEKHSDAAEAHAAQVAGWRLSLDPQLHVLAPATFLARFVSPESVPGQLWLRDVHEGVGGRRVIEMASISSLESTPPACAQNSVHRSVPSEGSREHFGMSSVDPSVC